MKTILSLGPKNPLARASAADMETLAMAIDMNTGIKNLARSRSVTTAGTDAKNLRHRFKHPPPAGSRPTPISTNPV